VTTARIWAICCAECGQAQVEEDALDVNHLRVAVPLLAHLTLAGIDLGLGSGRPDDAVWLYMRDGRVLVLVIAGGAQFDIAAALPHWVVQLADDARGLKVAVQSPSTGADQAAVVYALPPSPLPLLTPAHPQWQAAQAFAATLDAELLDLLQDFCTHSRQNWLSVRNYNRLVLLDARHRQHRLQALRRFGALVAPMLLTAHRRPQFGARDAWRAHDDEVLAAIDQGRDLTGTLAGHYGIGRALVRAPLCQHPWPASRMKQAMLLALLDGVPAPARPQTPSEWTVHEDALDALEELAGRDPQALRALGAAVFRADWRTTWAGMLRQHDSATQPLARRLLDVRDFLTASLYALQAAGALPALPRLDGRDVWEHTQPMRTRLALCWVQARGLASLLRASERWHGWVQQVQRADLNADAAWPALLGQWQRPNTSARECLSPAELTDEGQAMGHCVGSYDRHCAQYGHRIFHLTVGRMRATLQVAPRAADAFDRYQQIELLGPRNAPVSRTMQAWARWVLRRINQHAAWVQRQTVLETATQQRPRATQPQPDRLVEVRRIDAQSLADWQALLRAGLPQPLTRWHPGQVLLDCELAGVGHHDAEDCWHALATGQKLTLVREPTNPHDAHAVRVDAAPGCLGYLPRAQNQKVTQALDAGTPLQARLTGLSDRSEWGLRLWVRVKCAP